MQSVQNIKLKFLQVLSDLDANCNAYDDDLKETWEKVNKEWEELKSEFDNFLRVDKQSSQFISSADALIIIHQEGVRLRANDWAENEFMRYDPELGLVDEEGKTINGAVFLLNDEWIEV